MNRPQLTPLLLCLATSATLTGCSKFLAKDADGSSVSRVVGPEGGELTLPDGLWLKIEPDALVEDTEIKITKLDPQDDLVAGSHRYRFEPEGLVFSVPATLDIPYPDEGYALQDVRMYVENEDRVNAVPVIGGGDITLSSGGSSKYAQGTINHFSTYSCGVPATPTSTCFQPPELQAPGTCLFSGQEGALSWGITEWGGAGYDEAIDRCPTPKTTVSFSVNAAEIWILREWTVTGRSGVASIHTGTQDLSVPTRAFVPNAPGFDWRAEGAALPAPVTNPFFSWWSFEVWPENEYLGMEYDFSLTLVNAKTGEEVDLSGGYDSTLFKTECTECKKDVLVRGEDDRFRRAACEYEEDEDDTTDDGVADDGDTDDGGTDDGVNDDGGTTSGSSCDDPLGITESYWSGTWNIDNVARDWKYECDGTWVKYTRRYTIANMGDACNGVSDEETQSGTWSVSNPSPGVENTIMVASGSESASWTLLPDGDTIRFPDGSTMIRGELRDPWWPMGVDVGSPVARGREPVGCNPPAGW